MLHVQVAMETKSFPPWREGYYRCAVFLKSFPIQFDAEVTQRTWSGKELEIRHNPIEDDKAVHSAQGEKRMQEEEESMGTSCYSDWIDDSIQRKSRNDEKINQDTKMHKISNLNGDLISS